MLTEQDMKEIESAAIILENPSLIAKISGVIGKPIENIIEKLPGRARDKINVATKKSLESVIEIAKKL